MTGAATGGFPLSTRPSACGATEKLEHLRWLRSHLCRIPNGNGRGCPEQVGAAVREAARKTAPSGIETDHEAQIFRPGINFFHIENWYSVHSVIRTMLKLMGLYWRGRRNAVQFRSGTIGISR